MKFRIWTIFWVFALLASAMATFGVIGILIASLVAWVGLFKMNTPESRLAEWLVPIGMTTLIVSLIVPQLGNVSESARRVSCKNNLQQIAMALLEYESNTHSNVK